MNVLYSIQNAADRAAVIEANLQIIDAVLFGSSTITKLRMKLKSGVWTPQMYDTATTLWYDILLVTTDGTRALTLSDTGEA